jgi:hypothetical protein
MNWLPEFSVFAIGALGGLGHFLVKKNWNYKELCKQVLGGGIAGVAFYFTGFPNSLNTFFAGYAGLDIVERIEQKLNLKEKIKDIIETDME